MEGKSELIKALAKATLEFEAISKDGNAKVSTKSGGQYGYSYATLDNIIHATKKALVSNGLNIRHYNELKEDGKLWLISELRHESGCESDKTESPIEKFTGDGYMSIIQNYGSVITYLKRYHVSQMLNLAIDDDNDGNIEQPKSNKAKPKTEEQKPQTQPQPEAKPSQQDILLKYIARINEIENIFELNNWAKKHTPDFKELPKNDQDKIRDLLSERRTILAGLQNEPEQEETETAEEFKFAMER